MQHSQELYQACAIKASLRRGGTRNSFIAKQSSTEKVVFVVAIQVVVMVEGHPHQTAISRCLRTRYGARGFPFFIVDSDRYGYLSKVVDIHLIWDFPTEASTAGCSIIVAVFALF